MKVFDIILASNPTTKELIKSFEAAVKAQKLIINSRGTLKTVPGCVHWHIVNGGLKGTLEATFEPGKKSLRLCYHSNRYADWIDGAIEGIRNELKLL
jgi:hypothetical protein